MRECNGCTECCTWLTGDSYGWGFGGGKSCKFLECNGCGVHRARPKSCENYFCAWSQELIEEEYRPDRCGFLVSVENSKEGQYLKVIETKEGFLDKSAADYFDKWSHRMNTPVFFVKLQKD